MSDLIISVILVLIIAMLTKLLGSLKKKLRDYLIQRLAHA